MQMIHSSNFKAEQRKGHLQWNSEFNQCQFSFDYLNRAQKAQG